MANFNFNKVILGGRLVATPELKQTPTGTAVTSFSIAVNRKGKRDTTDFIDCVAWKSSAEFITKYFGKGSSICIVGSLQKREWTDNNGNKRYATEVIVDEANFVDGKSDNTEDSGLTMGAIANAVQNANLETANFEEVSAEDDLPF